MTEQVGENIYIDGQRHNLLTVPELPDSEKRLVGIDRSEIEDTDSIIFSTACWREYIGTWGIKDGRLYLLSIDGTIKLLGEEPLFADWFTGELRIPNKQLVDHVHMGFGSIHTEEHFIDIKKGIITGGKTNFILKILPTSQLAQDFAKKYTFANNRKTYIESWIGDYRDNKTKFLVMTSINNPTFGEIVARLNVTNSYSDWSSNEDIKLLFEYSSGNPIAEIAKKHLRSTRAIRSRLNHLNFETPEDTPGKEEYRLDKNFSYANWIDAKKLIAFLASNNIVELGDVRILLQFLSCFSEDTNIGYHRFSYKGDIRDFEEINSELMDFYLEPYVLKITDYGVKGIELPYYNCPDALDDSDYYRGQYDDNQDPDEYQPSIICIDWRKISNLQKSEGRISIEITSHDNIAFGITGHDLRAFDFDVPPIENTGTLKSCLSKLEELYGDFELGVSLDNLMIDLFRNQIMIIDSEDLALIYEFDEENMLRREMVLSLNDLKERVFAYIERSNRQ